MHHNYDDDDGDDDVEVANADADLLGVLLLQLLSPVALFYCLTLPLVDEPFDQNINTFP